MLNMLCTFHFYNSFVSCFYILSVKLQSQVQLNYSPLNVVNYIPLNNNHSHHNSPRLSRDKTSNR